MSNDPRFFLDLECRAALHNIINSIRQESQAILFPSPRGIHQRNLCTTTMDLPQVYSNHLHINKAITNLLNINMYLHHHYFTTKLTPKFMIRT
ncbi:hypothetical protein BG006_006440 [Podila minutissima]|uniref:Uncharacterized protein n=1 Tax=Podila minutissima TaxID=64525 RepID=A0A9P5VLM3_9FUNG|nr:hypothetical protein BG006_006440 [Podila minutissima]